MTSTQKRTSAMAAAVVLAVYASNPLAQDSDAQPGAADFNQALARDYQALAQAENEQGDTRDGLTYTKRAEAAAAGNPTEPDQVELRQPYLKDTYVSELSDARQRLVAAFGTPGRSIVPVIAARAQSSFDCWLEQATEDLQPDDIEACKQAFLTAVTEVENAVPPVEAAPPPPPPTPPEVGSSIASLDNTHFDFDKASLRPAAIDKLDHAVQVMNDNPTTRVSVEGHTDSVGSDVYNQGLSERRARSVFDYLTSKGIDSSRLTTVGYGEDRPIASNDTEEGRAENRRVDLVVAGE